MRLLLGLLLYLLLPTQVEAMNVVRLGKPASPTTESRVVLTFSALTTTNQPITLTCQALPPGQSSFTAFYSTTLKPGGNSGTCEYVFGGAGEYRFRVESNDGTDTVYSETVSVVSGATSVSGVSNWKSEKVGCQYKLSFEVPHDPSLNRVEIFRANTQSFSTSEATSVLSTNVSSGQSLTHTDTPPSCQTYYYAARLVSLSGLSSGLSGDAITTPVLVAAAPTQPATLVSTPSTPNRPSPTPSALELDEEEVSASLPSPQPDPSQAPVASLQTSGEVLGEQDNSGESPIVSTWIFLVLLALALTGVSAGSLIWWQHRHG